MFLLSSVFPLIPRASFLTSMEFAFELEIFLVVETILGGIFSPIALLSVLVEDLLFTLLDEFAVTVFFLLSMLLVISSSGLSLLEDSFRLPGAGDKLSLIASLHVPADPTPLEVLFLKLFCAVSWSPLGVAMTLLLFLLVSCSFLSLEQSLLVTEFLEAEFAGPGLDDAVTLDFVGLLLPEE